LGIIIGDVWLHSKDCPGAHVIVKAKTKAKPFMGHDDFAAIKKDLNANKTTNRYNLIDILFKNNDNNIKSISDEYVNSNYNDVDVDINSIYDHVWSGALQLASNLAAFYSDKRNDVGGVEITIAEPKHVLKPRYERVYIYIYVHICMCIYVCLYM